MAVATMFTNSSEAFVQTLEQDVRQLKETNALSWNAFRNNVESRKVGEKGLKVVYDNLNEGGHSTPTANRPDWNEPVAGDEVASYVYPVRYRLPMIFDSALIRDYKNKIPGAGATMARKLKNRTTVALKRLNRNFYGDGTGTLAFSTSSITAPGSATMNCDTTPASTFGHTKGAMWLAKGNTYQAINASTGTARGLFTVTTTGASSCTINLISGTITSGDPIVDVNTYNGYYRGMAHLISNTNRIVQGVNTADVPALNSPTIDLALAPLSFAYIEDLLTTIQVRGNTGRRAGKVLFLPPGQSSVLRKSAQNLRLYEGAANVAQGIMEDIDFGTNINAVIDPDCDEDRVYAVAYDEFGMLEEMPLGDVDWDGQDWRMLFGANNAGSERLQRGIGWDGNLFRRGNALGSAFIKRAAVSGVITQVSAG